MVVSIELLDCIITSVLIMAALRSCRKLLLVSRHVIAPCRQPWAPLFPVWTSSRRIATHCSPQHAKAISVLPTNVDTSSAEYKENVENMREVIGHLETLTKEIREGGPAKAREKHVARNKMLPRDRVAALIDPGTSFLELSTLAGQHLYEGDDVPAGGIITGVGVVEGVTCIIVANDSTVKGGTYYPITVKKHLRAQAIAEENNLP